MARIEWVALRLNNWALWKDRERGGATGFATQSSLLAERVDRYREININETIDSTDAELTNQAVESLKPSRPELHRTLMLLYLDNAGIPGTARREGCAVSTVHDRLAKADRAIAEWFAARADGLKKKSFHT